MSISTITSPANHSEIATARALLKHSVEIILPSNYAPHGIVPNDGEMRVTGIQATKISKYKAVLVVKFLSPASLKETEIQLFCTSLEPKTRMGQDGDLTLLTAIRKTHPHAKTLHDIGVRAMSDADTTRIIMMLTHVTHRGINWSCGPLVKNPAHNARFQYDKGNARLNSRRGGSFFDVTQVKSLYDETSERNSYCEGFNVRASRDPDG